MAQRPDWLPPPPRRGMPDGIKVLLIVAALLALMAIVITVSTVVT